MELIYLWVKEYKNLKNFGISLNPYYSDFDECKYTNAKIFIKLCTTKYKSIFNKGLNVITILGQNGVGKSNLCKILACILRSPNYKNPEDDFFDEEIDTDYCLIYKGNNQYFIKSNIKSVNLIIDNKPINCIKNENQPIHCALFNPFLNIEDDYVLNFTKHEKLEDANWIKINNYFYYDRFRLYDTSHALRKLFAVNYNKKKNLELLNGKNSYLVFDHYGRELDIVKEFEWLNYQIKRILPNSFKNYAWKNKKLWEFIDSLESSNNEIIKMAKNKSFKNVTDAIGVAVSNGCYMFFLLKVAEIFLLLEGNENILTEENLYKGSIELNDYYNTRLKHKNLYEFYKNVENIFNKKINNYEYKSKFLEKYINEFNKIIKELKRLEYNLFRDKEPLLKYLELIDNNKLRLRQKYMKKSNLKENKLFIRLNKLGIFNLNYYKITPTDVYSFLDLSTGEQRILRFFADTVELIENYELYNTSILIFDEMDLSWHPEWQRKMVYFVNDIVKKLSNNKIKLNIIFTTHSPFILSDMQKYNVRTITQNDKNHVFVNKENIIETFATNIHSIFASPFIMGSTIGELAEQHIKAAVKILSKYDQDCEINCNNANNLTIEYKNEKQVMNLLNMLENGVQKRILEKMLEMYKKNKACYKNETN